MLGWGWRAVLDPAVLPDVEALESLLASGEPFEMVFSAGAGRGVPSVPDPC